MSSSPTTAPPLVEPLVEPQAQRETVQHLLPTCHRCRRLRRKCDTQLPSCRVCEKARAECTFYDPALKQVLPRSYVHSLLNRIERLQALKNGDSNATSLFPSDNAQPLPAPSPSQENTAPTDTNHNGDEAPLHSVPYSPSFDVIIPSTTAAGRSRYWGSSSVFALTAELLQHAAIKGFASHEDVAGQENEGNMADDRDDDQPSLYEFMADPTSSRHYAQPPADDNVHSLVDLYLISLNTLYGFVDQVETNNDLQTYLALRQQPGFSPHMLHGEHAHRFFRITMMCAISCANQARYRPRRTAECLAYYADAVTCVEEVTSEATPDSLRALLLLIVFCLFYPRKGDIWKLLDYACRLTIELGYHTEETEPGQMAQPGAVSYTHMNVLGSAPEAIAASPSDAAQSRSKIRRSTFWGLYAIERIVGQLFGRGSDLPESIITTEYPSSLHVNTGLGPMSVVSGPSTGSSNGMGMPVDQMTLQGMSIAHHYRLVYLRSEIFRVMYLPASPPNLGWAWLKETYTTLYAWRRELAVSEDLTGVATLTCDVGYDATMCFLFQSHLMHALRSTANAPSSTGDNAVTGSDLSPNTNGATGGGLSINDANNQHNSQDSPTLLIASDPFYSAINLIRTYERIIRAPERSTLGTYPMTFLSALYIYLACSTLLAHALLRVDGRAKTLKRMSELDSDAVSENEAEELDWNAFLDVSSSCLILLAWCGERWPGMLGMLGVYQKLFGRMTRELIKKGVIQ